MKTPCVEAETFRDKDGYCRTRRDGRQKMAHRVAWEDAHGPIPPGMTVDHMCWNPACINPDHLRLLTHRDNSRFQRSALKTHCINGHEYTFENTYLRPRGGRDCRICICERQRLSVERRKQVA